MAWKLAKPHSDRKPVVHCEKPLEKTGLLYKNEADLVRHIHMVSRRCNKTYVQNIDVVTEKTVRFNLTGKKVDISSINCHKKMFTFFNS